MIKSTRNLSRVATCAALTFGCPCGQSFQKEHVGEPVAWDFVWEANATAWATKHYVECYLEPWLKQFPQRWNLYVQKYGNGLPLAKR